MDLNLTATSRPSTYRLLTITTASARFFRSLLHRYSGGEGLGMRGEIDIEESKIHSETKHNGKKS
jgi:hypothetical protein